jgi:hypothetical protein
MNLVQEKVLFHLTGHTAFDEDAEKQLSELCQTAPYFVPGKFLLAARGMDTGALTRIEAGRQLVPCFIDSRWLSYQLGFLHELLPPVPEPEVNPTEEPIQETSQASPVTTEPEDAIIEIEQGLQESPVTTTIQDHAGVLPEQAPEENEQITGIAQALQEPTAQEMPEPEADNEPDDTDTLLPEDATEGRLSSMLSSQLADFKKPVTDETLLELPAEPKKLHTIDYFASQGIRVDLANAPQDKLTSKLLKFTDWLKQIKQVQTQPQDLGTHPEMEKAAAENARQSNTPREIVTEAMADVLVKQGQSEKAIQLYIKLSFLFPEKSSYFAAKIEQLKGI